MPIHAERSIELACIMPTLIVSVSQKNLRQSSRAVPESFIPISKRKQRVISRTREIFRQRQRSHQIHLDTSCAQMFPSNKPTQVTGSSYIQRGCYLESRISREFRQGLSDFALARSVVVQKKKKSGNRSKAQRLFARLHTTEGGPKRKERVSVCKKERETHTHRGAGCRGCRQRRSRQQPRRQQRQMQQPQQSSLQAGQTAPLRDTLAPHRRPRSLSGARRKERQRPSQVPC